MKKAVIAALLMLTSAAMASAQRQLLEDMQPLCDTLSARLKERTTVTSRIDLSKIMRRGNFVDLYFTKTFSDWSWSNSDLKWLRNEIESNLPESLSSYKLGGMYCKSVPVEDLATPRLGNDGKNGAYRYVMANPHGGEPFITIENGKRWTKGLYNRYIALWQSHGRYYNASDDCWKWQRPPLHRTNEDLYTQSYVLPFLIPMLENAGAYVLTPRERDTQEHEVICDNDPSFGGDRGPEMRSEGAYQEKGSWSSAGEGFADKKASYRLDENPFRMGTARQAGCVNGGKPTAEARWTPIVPERGRYAVYISYRSVAGSSTCARYTVRHMGGSTTFVVDQTRGGGTWIYLGTFEFDKGTDGSVTLDNGTPAKRKFVRNSVVTADAVRFGGGMGKIARGWDDSRPESFTTSGLPSYAEGALYWMQWAGMDASRTEDWERDYVKDYAGRGAWTRWMRKDKKIPVDMSLGFHTDAGVTPNDSTIGTLSIYTLKCEGGRKFSTGGDRMTGRLLCDFVQTQICNDIREDYNPDWSRREIWDRSYSESRTTDVPAMLLELLSHQNFADMKYGLDPAFRFTVSRSVYKGILKFLSTLYGTSYVVEPLPVHDFSATFCSENEIDLSWKASVDAKEPTATATGYRVYTRIDGGAFDNGSDVKSDNIRVKLEPGHVYSWKVAAWNDGGLSFPSEILSAGIAAESKGRVLVVNNFDRVSAPAWIDTPAYAGFDSRTDSGVPYVEDISYIGENYEFRRQMEWQSDDTPGHGASYADHAAGKVAGNSFDYPFMHGKNLMDLGWSFCSQSAGAFSQNAGEGYGIIDLICGKQISTSCGSSVRYRIYPAGMRKALYKFTSSGGNVIASGAYIATDAWDEIYPGAADDSYHSDAQELVRSVLGISYVSAHGTPDGKISGDDGHVMQLSAHPNSSRICVESPNAIKPNGNRSKILLRYTSGKAPAAVAFNASSHKAVSFGFPLESLEDEQDMKALLGSALLYISDSKK